RLSTSCRCSPLPPLSSGTDAAPTASYPTRPAGLHPIARAPSKRGSRDHDESVHARNLRRIDLTSIRLAQSVRPCHSPREPAESSNSTIQPSNSLKDQITATRHLHWTTSLFVTPLPYEPRRPAPDDSPVQDVKPPDLLQRPRRERAQRQMHDMPPQHLRRRDD